MSHDLAAAELELGVEVFDPEGSLLARLSLLEWESAFFDRRIAGLSIDLVKMRDFGEDALRRSLEITNNRADQLGFTLVQIHIDVTDLPFVPTLEAAGFRLVDTRATFFSRVELSKLTRFEAPFGALELARPSDIDDIRRLTSECFARNPSFISRYKHPSWFTVEDSERWYAAWIENHFGDRNSLFGVWRVDEKMAAYYFYSRKGERKGLPVFKGMLTAVSASFRGHRAQAFLQSFLYDHMDAEEIWLDNTTQLTNIPALHNHMTSDKKLDRIELTFFR